MGTNITGIGNANAIGFKSRVTGGIYFPPELKDALVGVWSAYGKSNDSTDRNIIKNKIKDRGGDFVISNAAFKLNSGFGKYEVDFTTWSKRNVLTSNNDNSFSFESKVSSSLLYYSTTIGVDTPSFKIKANISNCLVYYYYINDKGTLSSISILDSGEFELPISHNTLYNGNIGIGFEIGRINGTGTGTITQIPSYQGAFVTDGIDDLITSTKTVQDMLGGSNEITVVSMINTITPYRLQLSYTNAFPINRTNKAPLRNEVSNTGKTGIYGYTYKNNVVSVINNVLGDKNDYTAGITGEPQVDDRFEVTRTKFNSSVAWYWTFIAKKALTTDQINQVIAYFNLDRTLKPDILCNIEKQGITNENHAEFGDKLIDFSGNGRDIQLNNIAWDGNSGIGKYNYPNWKVTATIANTYSTIVNYPTVNGTYSINVNGVSELMQSIGLHLEIKYTTSTGIIYNDIKQDGVYSYILPDGATNLTLRFGGIPGIVNEPCNITITQIPSHAGALCLDGVNDFGKVTGLPIYKDYTVIADYERFYLEPITEGRASILSKSSKVGDGSFIFNLEDQDGGKACYTFGGANGNISDDITRIIRYQSKYYNTKTLSIGTAEDNDFMVLGKVREVDSRHFYGVIYSLMTFPYSMSEFLIERQLKKHKLGTLYPDMVEFRPIVKSNSEYQVVDCYIDTLAAVVGNYYPINSKLRIAVTTKGAANEVTSLTVNGVSLGTPSVNGNRFTFNGTLSDKSPQKINITIDEYIRYEDIVQPYPVLLRFKDENGNEVSWGGKVKLGSSITRIGLFNDCNLLKGIYTVSNAKLNGSPLPSTPHVVERQMVFTCTATYLLDDNEPKCILSPSRLRIPNNSYKILGYIPDISGHGNHGKINNSAYAGASGANGYLQNFSEWTKASGVSSTDSVISSSNNLVAANGWIAYVTSGTVIPTFKVEISGIPVNGNLRFEGSDQILVNGVNTIQGITTTKITGFYISSGYDNDWSNLKIEQIGEYEGAYCLDGVDDFVTIPTLSSGGKQVLMKVNSRKSDCYLYDQRNNWTQYLGIVSTKDFIAYNYSNQRGKTYIDGILNENITANDLIGITHNITVTNNRDDVKQYSPCIGTSFARNSYAQMALYDFMLFDNISTDDKIKELNEYVGIEGNTE
jgi:hypothetical protein